MTALQTMHYCTCVILTAHSCLFNCQHHAVAVCQDHSHLDCYIAGCPRLAESLRSRWCSNRWQSPSLWPYNQAIGQQPLNMCRSHLGKWWLLSRHLRMCLLWAVRQLGAPCLHPETLYSGVVTVTLMPCLRDAWQTSSTSYQLCLRSVLARSQSSSCSGVQIPTFKPLRRPHPLLLSYPCPPPPLLPSRHHTFRHNTSPYHPSHHWTILVSRLCLYTVTM